LKSKVSTVVAAGSSASTEERDQQSILEIDNVKFTTMHNIVYYLYTGKVNMHYSANDDGSYFDPSYTFTPPEGHPPAADPFELYLAANMFLLEEIEHRTERYLRLTCSVENILSRLGDVRLEPYDALREFYIEFVARSDILDVVRKQPAFKELVEGVDEIPEKSNYRREIIHQLFMKLSLVITV